MVVKYFNTFLFAISWDLRESKFDSNFSIRVHKKVLLEKMNPNFVHIPIDSFSYEDQSNVSKVRLLNLWKVRHKNKIILKL